MDVSVDLSAEHKVPFAIIYAESITEEVQNAIDFLSSDNNAPITAQHQYKTVILQPTDIFMVRIENGETIIYDKHNKYFSRKRLYELQNKLGRMFMQISKSVIVNLKQLDSVEAGFNGTMLLKLKNGCNDYVSRKYLPDFKKYLGM